MPDSGFAIGRLAPKRYSSTESSSKGVLEYSFGGISATGPGADQHGLLDRADSTALVEQRADRGADAVGPVVGFGADTDPFAVGHTMDVHDEIGVHECPLSDVELRPDAVRIVGDREQPLQRGHGLALDEVDRRLQPRLTR